MDTDVYRTERRKRSADIPSAAASRLGGLDTIRIVEVFRACCGQECPRSGAGSGQNVFDYVSAYVGEAEISSTVTVREFVWSRPMRCKIVLKVVDMNGICTACQPNSWSRHKPRRPPKHNGRNIIPLLHIVAAVAASSGVGLWRDRRIRWHACKNPVHVHDLHATILHLMAWTTPNSRTLQ